VARHPFQQLAPERQDEILHLAGLEFARSGFQGTSYNQLLERLHLGKSSAYYYFDDKRDLFLTVIERCYSSYFTTITKLERPGSAPAFWAFVHRASVRGFEFMLEDPTAAGLMQCVQRERSVLGELLSVDLLATMNDFYAQLIVEGQALEAVRTDVPQALLVETVRTLSVTFDQWFIRERGAAESPPAASVPPSAASVPPSAASAPPSAEQAALLFTDLVRRMVERRA
jgi:AcrR family transcriptional regulator